MRTDEKKKRKKNRMIQTKLVGSLNEQVDRCHKKPVWCFTQTKSKQTIQSECWTQKKKKQRNTNATTNQRIELTTRTSLVISRGHLFKNVCVSYFSEWNRIKCNFTEENNNADAWPWLLLLVVRCSCVPLCLFGMCVHRAHTWSFNDFYRVEFHCIILM